MAVSVTLTVGPMRMADVPAVHEVERLSFSTPWPPFAFEQELAGNRMASYLVVRSGDQLVGFGGVWTMVDEAHITTFAVHPAWRRRGVGRRLLLELLELAVGQGASRMTLEVRVSNTAAQGLYHRFGFLVAGRRPAYYSDDGEDAVVMTTPELSGPTMGAVIAVERSRREREANR